MLRLIDLAPGVDRLKQSATGIHVVQGLLEAQSEEVQARDGSNHMRHSGAKDIKGKEPRQAGTGGGDGTGCI